MALWAQNFLRLRRAKRSFASGTVPYSPEPATLAVTIIPVSLEGGVAARGGQFGPWNRYELQLPPSVVGICQTFTPHLVREAS